MGDWWWCKVVVFGGGIGGGGIGGGGIGGAVLGGAVLGGAVLGGAVLGGAVLGGGSYLVVVVFYGSRDLVLDFVWWLTLWGVRVYVVADFMWFLRPP